MFDTRVRKWFFSTHAWKRPFFLRWKDNRKSNISSVGEISRSSGRKSSIFPAIWRLRIPDLPFTFHAKKVLFLHLLKKLLCVTWEQLTFSDSDDDFEHSWTTRAQSSSSLEKVDLGEGGGASTVSTIHYKIEVNYRRFSVRLW